MTLNQAVAEDITHDAFLVLIKDPKRFRAEQGSLLTYMCSIARNLVMNHLRRKRNGDARLDDLDTFDVPENGNDPVTALLNHELGVRIAGCIAALPPAQREVIVLREYEGLSYEEMANITETELATVKTRLYRARQTLAKNLESYIATTPQEDE